jgi:16S rRNA (cytosine1402-N4)-methyltransferase
VSDLDKPKRRPRYAGKNPRAFHEKYKERDPARYAADVAKVLASGKTPAGTHRPIMVRSILDVLRVQPGETVVDCTLGYGGHAEQLLAAVQPGGRLIALDQDPIELPKTEARLRALGFPDESLVVRRTNFAGLAAVLAEFGGADAILADLGLSSMQIDDPARGFTFKVDAPLDMRMNPQRSLPASALLARVSEPELAAWLSENGDEPHAGLLAAAMVRARAAKAFESTTQLATCIRSALRNVASTAAKRMDEEEIETSVRRVFQAIRIVVNDEFGVLDTFLRNLPHCLKAGGRVAVLTFHSGEDRRVKHAFKTALQEGVFFEVNDDVVRASAEERRANPRSAPAKLRWAVRSDSAIAGA